MAQVEGIYGGAASSKKQTAEDVRKKIEAGYNYNMQQSPTSKTYTTNTTTSKNTTSSKAPTTTSTTKSADLITGAAPLVSNSTQKNYTNTLQKYTGSTAGQAATVTNNLNSNAVGYTFATPSTGNNGGNTGSYGSGSGAVASTALAENQNYYTDLMNAFMEKNNAARQAAIDAILANLESVKGTYKTQIQKVIDDYQSLINENEVNRERTRRRIREDQANRGQLDSGMGRQERLNLDTTYDTNQANLNSARESAVNEIYNLIAQAESEANTNRANVESNYANALLQWQLANQ